MFEIYITYHFYRGSLNAPRNSVLTHSGEPLWFESREAAEQYIAEYCMHRELRHGEYAPPEYTVRRVRRVSASV